MTVALARLALAGCLAGCLSLGAAAAPLAAGSKTPTCAKGQHSTARKPCRARTAAVALGKPIPVCEAGQSSTIVAPCLFLDDGGPPITPRIAATGSGSKGGTTSTITPEAPAGPVLVGPHINDHRCQAADGTVFICQTIVWDPGNPDLTPYPAIPQ